jgi:hypothetical protein
MLIVTNRNQNIYDYKRNVMCSAWILVQEYREYPASLCRHIERGNGGGGTVCFKGDGVVLSGGVQ